VSRPAPKRRADISAATSDTESGGGRRSANSHAAPRHAKPGSRRAPRRRLSLIPTPAVLGATALVIAGGGAVVVSSNSGGSDDSYENAASQPGEGVGATYARGGPAFQVSRSVDRAVVEEQARQQAEQYTQAMAELAARSQKRAKELEANQWVLPVVGYTLSARWGEISYLWSTYHTGLDFSAAAGAEIVSVARGVVTYTGYDSSYGYKVEVTLDDGTMIWYCHQTEYVVSEGDEVDPGDLIGYVGSTGNTTGPHLHLEVRIPDGTDDGQDVDPYDALVEHGVQP
jgi:murein DD-endopeptidase MepM/ murein hydrolase activator NlpD